MKKFIFLFLVFTCSIFINTSKAQSSKVVKTKYFSNINSLELVEKNVWLNGDEQIAAELEKSYNLYSSTKNFKTQLIKFIDNNADKCYWIATYLNDDYYTNINNEALSFELFEMGLKMLETKPEQEQIKYLYVIGKSYYAKNLKDNSLSYLLKGFKLSEKYPGNVPTWNSLKESEEINHFIQGNL